MNIKNVSICDTNFIAVINDPFIGISGKKMINDDLFKTLTWRIP